MDPDSYCRERVAQPGSAIYYATLFLSADAGGLARAAETLRRELLDIVHRASDWSVARQRLGWWSNEIVAARDGSPTHPATLAMAARMEPARWRRPGWVSILGALGQVVDSGGFESPQARDALCRALGTCIDPLLPCSAHDDHEAALVDLGYWLQRSEFARAPVAPAPVGLHYLPRHSLADAAIAPDWPQEPATPVAVTRWLATEITTCRDALKRLEPMCRRSREPLVASLRARALIETATLASAARHPDRLPGSPGAISPIRKLWFAWRAFR